MEYVCPILDRPTVVEETGCRQDSWSLVRCRETGFVFLANPPDYSQLETEFAWEKTVEDERQRRLAEEPVLARVSSFATKVRLKVFAKRNKIAAIVSTVAQNRTDWRPLHLLDIGCGWGNLMVDICKQLAGKDIHVVPHGIEVSKQLATYALERVEPYGGTVLMANAVSGASQLPPASIHVAVMSSFLEHECQPLHLLQHLNNSLAADGVVVLKVPNYACWNRVIRKRRWCGYRFPDHVNYFTPDTLSRLAQEAGFTVTRQNFMDRFPLSDNMYAVLSKK